MMRRLTLKISSCVLSEVSGFQWPGQPHHHANGFARRNRISAYQVNQGVRSSYDEILGIPLRFPALAELTLAFPGWEMESDEVVLVRQY